MMREVSLEDAVAKYGDRLRISPQGAIEKSDNSFRVIHDGTNGSGVNPQIKVRDQVRCPGAPEQKAVMRKLRARGTRGFIMKGDASKAHRRVRVREEDWGLQACKLRDGYVWLNEVGTFVSSSCSQ